jgi:hypothetical protein
MEQISGTNQFRIGSRDRGDGLMPSSQLSKVQKKPGV